MLATPGRHTSKARTSYDGRAAAIAATDSPFPEPISTTSGASRPNHRAGTNDGSSTALSGISHSSTWRSQAARWVGVSLLPRRV